MDSRARTHLFISGRVQGVRFRAHAQKEAQKLSLTGWAHNCADGRVEIVCEGDAQKVEQFIYKIKKGPPLAKVERVEITHESYKSEFRNFEIREFGF